MKKLLTIFAALLLSLGSYAQHHEIGIFGGVSYYMGDLTPTHFSIPGYNFGLQYRYAINRRFAVRIVGHYGQINGDSKNDTESKQYKNLSFHSHILDIEGGIEINFLEYEPGSKKHRFTPFIFGGLNIFSFNPKTYYGGEEYELQPLGTEGQGLTAYPDSKPYKLAALAIPFGIGIKWSVSKRVSLSMEWGLRKTFTDYLDDVSTRYPDPSILASEKGAVAAALSNRINEQDYIDAGYDLSIGPNGVPNNKADFAVYMASKGSGGAQRGGDGKDWYGIAGITVMFKIVGKKQSRCPAYKQRNYFKEYLLF
ncbi:MAG: hypothetical protein KAG84_00585 [Bacteroidales bacterium]|nr:hypothetical protein [Bacteroidales bacterium]